MHYHATAAKRITGLSGVTSFGVGNLFGCAVGGDRRAKCWGRMSVYGLQGNGTEEATNERDPSVATPVVRASD